MSNATAPQYISKYRIDGTLGKGAMGIVYLGFDESIERKVAIKTIAINSNNKTLVDEYKHRFEQEAKALAKCTHPNIVTIMEYGHEKDLVYMVLEYISDVNLEQYIRKNRKLSLMQAMSYFAQLLKALHTAHNSGIIHRDIKPENILMVNQKNIKLTDFGIAKIQFDDQLTQIGMTMGTPRYMAPEQLFGQDEIGTYTDIYSLFVLLYEMMGFVTRKSCYEFVKLKTLAQIAKHNKLDSNTLVPDCMVDFFDKGLKTSHLDRYQKITDVIKDLKPIIAQLNQLRADVPLATNTTNRPHEVTSLITGSTISGASIEQKIELSGEEFDRLRDYLSDIIGPMSDFIITDAMKHQHSYDAFIMSIADKIDNIEARERFVDDWRKG